VAIAFGLARRKPRWRALVAFALVLPAPYFAWREHMRARAGMWVGGVLVYLVALLLASRGS
jgi:CelD/BcsL family acetyltransferase involved in cellulose biosynthesis